MGGGSGEPYVMAFSSPQPLRSTGRLAFSGGDGGGLMPWEPACTGGVADLEGTREVTSLCVLNLV